MADTPTLELRIRDNADDAVGGLLRLANSLSALKANLGRSIGLSKLSKEIENFTNKCNTAFGTDLVSNINKVSEALDNLTKARDIQLPDLKAFKRVQEQVGDLADTGASEEISHLGQELGDIDHIAKATSDSLEAMNNTVSESKSAYAGTASAISEVKTEADATASAMAQASNEAGNYVDAVKNGSSAAQEAAKATKEHSLALKDLIKNAKGASGPLYKIAHAFKRILFYRVIRSVLKEISKGFSEGIKNVREYSKAIGGSFDKAMTSAENALFKMKNSLGAALAPAIELVIPYVQQLVSWFITLVNYANQFFALLNGKTTWTKAVDAAASDFEKTKKSASGAAKEIKNLLAGFDELNIIQSESGGNGGGSGTGIKGDYKDLFEEESEFNSKIKEIVTWIKDNLEDIKKIAAVIGGTFATWGVSKAFGGVVAGLQYLAALGVLYLDFKITEKFDEKFLETGEPGYLVGSVLTAMLGALATKSVLNGVLGDEKLGEVGFGLAFIVSAAADITASIKSLDTTVLSERNLRLMLVAAVKGGVAGGAIGKALFSLTGVGTVKAFGGAALATFGIGVGLKAIAQSIQTEENDETIMAKAGASLALGAGIGLEANTLFNLSGAKSMGLAAGAGLFIFGVATGISAIAHAVEPDGKFNSDALQDIALASLEMGEGIVLSGRMLGLERGNFITGLGIAGLIVSAAVGVKAVVEEQNAGITKQTYIDTAIASLGAGVSTFGILASLGVTGGVAGVVAGGLAIATVAAVVGVIAYLDNLEKDENIHWGNESYSEAQVRAYVKEKMFDVDVDAQVGVINTLLDNTTVNTTNISTKLTQLLGTMYVLKLGVDDKGSILEIYNTVFGEDRQSGLIGDVKKTIENRKQAIKLGLQMMPYIDSIGNNISDQLLASGITGWNKVEEFMTKLGKDLSGYLLDDKGEFKTQLETWERDKVEELLGAIRRVSAAVANAEFKQGATTNLGIKLSGMTEENVNDALKYFDEYKQELEKGYVELATQKAVSFEALAEAYEAMAEEEERLGHAEVAATLKTEAEKYKAEAEAQYASILGDVETAISEHSERGRQLIIDTFSKVYSDVFSDIVNKFNLPTMEEVWGRGDLETNEDVVEAIAEGLKDKIYQATGKAEEEWSKRGIDVTAMLPDTLKGTFLTSIANAYGLEIADAVAKAIGGQVPDATRKAIEDSLNMAATEAAAENQDELWKLTLQQDLEAEKAEAEAKAKLEAEAVKKAMEDALEDVEVIPLFSDEWKDVETKEVTEWWESVLDNLGLIAEPDEREALEEAVMFDVAPGDLAKLISDFAEASDELDDAKEKFENLKQAITDLYDIKNHPEIYGKDVSDWAKGVLDDNTPGNIYEKVREAESVLAEAEAKYTKIREELSKYIEIPEVNVSGLVDPVGAAEKNIKKSVDNIKKYLNSLNIGTTINVGFQGGSHRFASGGFVDSGEMFIAREAGPELVGRIGNRTAVANNDQIVAGVANGVAAGQSEQNALLRRQNEILMQMLQKSGKVEAVPSAEWGRFMRRSAEMYAVNAGV